ncbi:MAG TPA: SdiA-regulated domain-containing protein [Flavobacterium sp.]|nr:SdiA-regulated domain-containing protein [Flavobacterium sp.]
MIPFKHSVAIVLATAAFAANAQKAIALKPIKSIAIKIPEPSDICYNAKSDDFFIVSDNGILFEADRDGKIVRQVKQNDTDFEAVYSDDKNVYAVDETHRNIYIYDVNTLKIMRIVNVPYNGAKNKGYEAFTFNKSKNNFVIFTEKDPSWLFELDADFKITNTVDISNIATDIAAAQFHDNFLWLLSDEDMAIMKLNPNTYEVVGKWSLPVINPEGFAFDKDGSLLVTCDDMQRLYYFNNPDAGPTGETK